MHRSPVTPSLWAAAFVVGSLLMAATPVAAQTGSTASALTDTRAGGIDVSRVRKHVAALSRDIGPRPVDSENSKRAAAYIEAELEATGLTVERVAIGEQTQPEIRVGSMLLFRERTVMFRDDNLVLRIPGADADAAPILIMGHYDTVSVAPGAIDNGVSVGLLLELARVLNASPPPRPIIIAWTAGEEQRLAGSRALVGALKGVGLAVSLDLVGWRTGLVLTGLSNHLGKPWLSWIASVARSAEVDLSAPVLMRLISRRLPQIERSDHGPFTAAGIPAFQLYHRGKDRVYRAYHTKRDQMDQIVDAGVDEVGRFLVALARTGGALPAKGGSPGWWSPIPGGPHVFPTTVVVVVGLLLASLAVLGLISLWRRRPRWRTKHFGLAVALPVYIAVWLAVAGYFAIAASVTDHPRPWVHRPTVYVLPALFLAAALGVLIGWCLERARKIAGRMRYLTVAIVVPLLVGLALMVIGAAELAWIILWPAAAFGGVALSRRQWQAWPCFVASLLPLGEPLSAPFLREATYHGFLTAGMPLGLVIGLLLLPHTFAGIYMVRRWLPALPARGRNALALVAGCLLVVSLCIVIIIAREPTCTGEQFQTWNLACEILRE